MLRNTKRVLWISLAGDWLALWALDVEVTYERNTRRGIPADFLLQTTPRATLAGLHALQNHRDPLAHADAHGAQRVAALGAMQLVHRGCYQASSAGAQRMSQRNCAAVGIHLRRIVRQA